jgi:hypothetical protein
MIAETLISRVIEIQWSLHGGCHESDTLLRDIVELKKENAKMRDTRPSTMQHSIWVFKRVLIVHVIRFIINTCYAPNLSNPSPQNNC